MRRLARRVLRSRWSSFRPTLALMADLALMLALEMTLGLAMMLGLATLMARLARMVGSVTLAALATIL